MCLRSIGILVALLFGLTLPMAVDALPTAKQTEWHHLIRSHTWVATIHDNRLGDGHISLDFPHGTYSATFTGGIGNAKGSINYLITAVLGPRPISFELWPTAGHGFCRYFVTASISHGTMVASYDGCNGGSGTFTASQTP